MNEIILNRKPIFDAVRRMLGRSFLQNEVELLDRAIDAALGIARDALAPKLGTLSALFESGGRGPGTISGGLNDPGGVSYGTYQLASRTGTAARFLADEGKRWAHVFGKAAPGSAAFSRIWRQIADREAEVFGESQHAFIKRTHYRPAVDAVRDGTGLDLDLRHPAVRDVTWSVAVQHGGAARILIPAVGDADDAAAREDGVSYDMALIRAIYARRSAYVLRVADRSRQATAGLLRAIVRDRYPAELQAALAMLERE